MIKTTLRLLFLLITLLIFPVHADEKTQALENLWQAFEADSYDIDRLIDIRQAVDNALVISAIASIHRADLPRFGNRGPVIIEFSDYQCGYCKRVFQTLDKLAQQGKAQVVVIEFPVLGPMSEQAATYALAARQQGKYQAFHRLLMSNNQALSEQTLNDLARRVNLDTDQLQAMSRSPQVSDNIDKNHQLAALLGIRSTPSFVIGDVIVIGALSEEDLNKLLD